MMLALAHSFEQTCLPAVARPLMVTPIRVCRREDHAHARRRRRTWPLLHAAFTPVRMLRPTSSCST
jgi:hypothetical protein